MTKKIYLLIFVLLIAVASLTPIARVRSVEDLSEQLESDDIAWLKKQNWLWCSSIEMAETIPNRHRFEKITIQKIKPLGISVVADLRTPYVAIESGGYYINIDMYGMVLDIGNHPLSSSVLKGFSIHNAKIGHVLIDQELKVVERAVQIVYMFKRYTDYEPNVYLKDGKIYHDFSGAISVNFGAAESVEKQFNVAIAAYQNMLNKNVTSGVINVSNHNQCIIEPVKR